jgi:hypothetical protein
MPGPELEESPDDGVSFGTSGVPVWATAAVEAMAKRVNPISVRIRISPDRITCFFGTAVKHRRAKSAARIICA